jgi:hypothetical protein
MKRKIFIGIAAIVVVAVTAVNVNFALQSNDLSALSLANVEALAGEDDGYDLVTCYTVKKTNSTGGVDEFRVLTCSGTGSLSCSC